MISFATPAALWALVLAVLPVVLYLLFRLRRRNVDWGASYILKMTLKRRVKESRWRQYAVLALRTLLLAALIAAFALPHFRPRDGRGGFPRGGPGALTRVVLLDNSGSMLAAWGSAARDTEARRLASLLLSDMAGGDTFALIPMAGGEPRVFDAPAGPERLADALRAIPVSPGPADPALALELACRTFLSSVTPNRQMIVLSDFAAADYPDPAALASYAELLLGLGVACRFHAVSAADDSNVSIQSAELGTDFPTAGQTLNLYAGLANFGPRPVVGGQLQVLRDARVIAAAPLDLAPDERKTLRIPVALPHGESLLELRIADDALPTDNRLPLAVSARAEPAVLLLAAADDAQKGFESETEFFVRALAGGDAGRVNLVRRTPAALTRGDLAAAQVLVVAGNALPPAELAPDVARWVRRGGGALVALSPEMDMGRLRPLLSSLFGVEPDAPNVAAPDYERFLFVQKSAVREPLLREFGTDVNGDIGRARIYNHWRLSIPAGSSGPETLLRLSNGEPLLLRARPGRGVALLWTTTLGGAWQSLVVHQAWVPLVARLLDAAAAGAEPPRNVAPPQPLMAPVSGAGPVFLATPDNTLVRVAPAPVGTQSWMRFDAASAPGAYLLSDADGRPLAHFTVAPDRRESDLRRLDGPALRALEQQFNTQLTETEEALAAQFGGSSPLVPAASAFALAALALLVVEGWLLRRWF